MGRAPNDPKLNYFNIEIYSNILKPMVLGYPHFRKFPSGYMKITHQHPQCQAPLSPTRPPCNFVHTSVGQMPTLADLLVAFPLRQSVASTGQTVAFPWNWKVYGIPIVHSFGMITINHSTITYNNPILCMRGS